jgi:hypothetical protein
MAYRYSNALRAAVRDVVSPAAKLTTQSYYSGEGGAVDPYVNLAWAAASSEYMIKGSGSHEFVAQYAGTGAATFTSSALLLPDHEGVYRTTPANTMPVQGARWDNGVPYTDTPEGAPLSTWPALYAAPELTNLVLYSNDLSAVPEWTWTLNTVDFSEVGITGEPNTASLLDDEGHNPAGYVSYNPSPLSCPASTCRIICKAKNAGTPTWVQWLGTVTNAYASFDLLTGQVLHTGGSIVGTDSVLINGWWHIYIEYSGNIERQRLYPFSSEPGDSHTGFGDGGQVIIGNYERYEGKTIAQVKGAAPIITAGSTVTSTAVTLDYNTGNHSDTEGGYYLEVNMETAGDILDGFLSTTGATFELDDGTTTTTGTWAAGTNHQVGVAYGSSLMSINVDGTWSSNVAYDGTLLSGALDIFRSATSADLASNIQRWDLSFTAAKAKIDDLMGAP